MNHFSLIALLSVVAAATEVKVPIKDNANHVQAIGKCEKDAKITLSLSTPADKLPFIFPKVNKEDTFTITATSGTDTPVDLPTFPGHFGIARFHVNKLVYTGKAKGEFEVYVIPPEVAAKVDGKEADPVEFSLKAEIECEGKDKEEKEFKFSVTNGAHALSFVASAAALAASLVFLL